MIFLKKFEFFDNTEHLKQRGIDVKKTRVIQDSESGDVYFWLYNLSGQLVGYQKYNPKYPKKNISSPRNSKYFTIVGDEDLGKKIAVWGLESFDSIGDEYLFIVEGIFDAARIQEVGYSAIAVLGNDPSNSLFSWLKTLPQKKIVIFDNDTAGNKLKKVGDYSFSVDKGKDINDLDIEEARDFLDSCINKIKKETQLPS